MKTKNQKMTGKDSYVVPEINVIQVSSEGCFAASSEVRTFTNGDFFEDERTINIW